MAGLAQVILTDHELDTILAWAAAYEESYLVEADSSRLTMKLAGIRRTLDCGCGGGACAAGMVAEHSSHAAKNTRDTQPSWSEVDPDA